MRRCDIIRGMAKTVQSILPRLAAHRCYLHDYEGDGGCPHCREWEVMLRTPPVAHPQGALTCKNHATSSVADFSPLTLYGPKLHIEGAGTTGTDDTVNAPSHYTRGGIETIDFIEAKGLGYNLGNVVKYVTRAGYKSKSANSAADRLLDLRKAAWYIAREIARG